MKPIEFRQAIRLAIQEEMERDPSVILLGEDVGFAGGVFGVTRGLFDLFGPTRVLDTPISEMALSGVAFGAAICGTRPIIEIMFGDFMMLAMDSLVNQSAKYWFLSDGQSSVPLVVRSAVGAGGRFGPIHSQIPATWLMSVPGIKIVAPSTANDARALLRVSIRDDNPVVFLEHKRLYATKGPLEDDLLPIGKARIIRHGGDVTIVSAMKGVHDALAAAERLQAKSIAAEVVDLRTIRPMDIDTVLQSAMRTRNLVVVEEGPRTGGWAAEVLAAVWEQAGGQVKVAWRITSPDIPLPYSPHLEDGVLPSVARIETEILHRLGEKVG